MEHKHFNYIVVSRVDDSPAIYPTEEPVGPKSCHCCHVFETRREALFYALKVMRNLQQNILGELASCENVIVTYMQELNITTEEEKEYNS